MNPKNFFGELKRRNVYKVAVAYAIVGWLLVQIATQVFPFLEIPNWVVRLVIMLVAVGFPIALVIAWAFELTPEGIKRTEDVDLPAGSGSKNRTWIYVAVIGAAFSIGLFFIGRYTARNSSSASSSELPAKSIAVLPFDNLSHDPENAYFAEGVQDEILTRLAKVADLKVISRTSTQRFKSAPANLPDIAKQLGVTNILEGSVQKSANQVRVSVQLINALNDAHLWAEIYDRKLTDIFAVESDIAKTIADNLQAKLSGSEKTALSKKPMANPEAYEFYLKGRFFWNKRTAADLRKSIDPLSLIINTNLGVAYVHTGRLDEAITQLRKTVEMDGAFYYARYSLALALELKDAIAEATAEYRKTISITEDPVPLGMLGRLYATHGRKDEAQQILQQLRQRREQRYTAAYCLALVYLGLGDRNEALKWLEEGYRERDGFNIGPIRVDPLLTPLHGDPRFEALAEKIVPAREFGKAVTQK